MDVRHLKGMWWLNAHSTTITDFERDSVPFGKLPLIFCLSPFYYIIIKIDTQLTGVQ